jgi:hypothetical protein
VIARQRAWADSTSLNTMARAAAALPAPRVTLVRSLTVEKVDSMGFVVRRWTQCSAREVVEREQLAPVVGDLRDGLGPLRARKRAFEVGRLPLMP